MNVVEAHELRKTYGSIVALDGISFDVLQGEVFGLIGPNGSGKTTTLRILSTLIQPTSGSASVLGYDVVKEAQKVKTLISYLPGEAGAYQNLTGREYLRFMGNLYASNKEELSQMIADASNISGLGDRLKDKSKTYSQGMARRLLIARSLMFKPKLAIMDEPTSGLDVVHATYVRRMIKDYVRNFGVTVLLSSHNMLEVDFLCDRIALINTGRILAVGSPAEIKETTRAENLEEAFMKVIDHG
ncbi:MAG TPA: ABC transporter ATP-binding protein [Conexivisphaerales archaeon]|nr:ABC transporter ATP-binding protein [Conexivisphaerales archaeon]